MPNEHTPRTRSADERTHRCCAPNCGGRTALCTWRPGTRSLHVIPPPAADHTNNTAGPWVLIAAIANDVMLIGSEWTRRIALSGGVMPVCVVLTVCVCVKRRINALAPAMARTYPENVSSRSARFVGLIF